MKEDEIKALQEEVDALKATLAEIQAMPDGEDDEDDYDLDDESVEDIDDN